MASGSRFLALVGALRLAAAFCNEQAPSAPTEFQVPETVQPEAESLGHTNGLVVRLDPVLHDGKYLIDMAVSDDDLQVDFTVSNPTSKAIKLLIRETPLEGMKSDMFIITNLVGKVMEYRGKDMKRVDEPVSSEYVNILPTKSVTKRLKIGGRYKLERDGQYTISMGPLVDQRLNGHMHQSLDYTSATVSFDIINTKAHEKRHQKRLKIRLLQKKQHMAAAKAQGTRRSGQVIISHDGSCSNDEVAAIANWHSDAIDKIAAASACTKESCRALVNTWFGSHTNKNHMEKIQGVYTRMAEGISSSLYSCRPNDCESDTFAYVYPTDQAQKVYLCDLTFDYPEYSEKVQTIMHELSHFEVIGDTNDNAYGESTCNNLAKRQPGSARKTADTFAYFAVYTNTCFRNSPDGYMPGEPPCMRCADSPHHSRADMVCGVSSAPTVAPPSNAPTPPPPPGDSCQYANDGECDDPRYCRVGTDNSDCTEDDVPQDTCTYANDGECDEPTYCRINTDATDCQGEEPDANGDDSCQWANDYMCDEPTYCEVGTDTTDCTDRRSLADTTVPTTTVNMPAVPTSQDEWVNSGRRLAKGSTEDEAERRAHSNEDLDEDEWVNSGHKGRTQSRHMGSLMAEVEGAWSNSGRRLANGNGEDEAERRAHSNEDLDDEDEWLNSGHRRKGRRLMGL